MCDRGDQTVELGIQDVQKIIGREVFRFKSLRFPMIEDTGDHSKTL